MTTITFLCGVGDIDDFPLRLCLKAKAVFGLLFEQGGAWQARFRPPDYALLY